MEEDLIFKKATLALGGPVLLPKDFKVPVRVSHSTAGPGAGSGSAVLKFNGMRVKKGLSYDHGDFELHVRDDGSLYLTKGGEPFLDRVEFEPVVYHCPEQAFITIDARCIFNCAFCASPRLPEEDYKGLSDAEIASMCIESVRSGRAKSVALTSGVASGGVGATAERFVNIVSAVRKELPEVPIGIEPYADSPEQIRAFREAGTDEIKLNLQAATPEIFKRVCPDLDRDTILKCLAEAVKCFGKGKVSSNIIIGLGETRDELENCMCQLCEMGVVPTVRPLRRHSFNAGPLKEAGITAPPLSPEELISVAKMHKEVLERYGLDTRTFHTMCLECTCCDLVPFRDL